MINPYKPSMANVHHCSPTSTARQSNTQDLRDCDIQPQEARTACEDGSDADEKGLGGFIHQVISTDISLASPVEHQLFMIHELFINPLSINHQFSVNLSIYRSLGD